MWIPGEAVPFRRTYGREWHGASLGLPVGRVRRLVATNLIIYSATVGYFLSDLFLITKHSEQSDIHQRISKFVRNVRTFCYIICVQFIAAAKSARPCRIVATNLIIYSATVGYFLSDLFLITKHSEQSDIHQRISKFVRNVRTFCYIICVQFIAAAKSARPCRIVAANLVIYSATVGYYSFRSFSHHKTF